MSNPIFVATFATLLGKMDEKSIRELLRDEHDPEKIKAFCERYLAAYSTAKAA